MRIISKFHDYYDTALGFGIDKNIIYERKKKEIKDKNLIEEIENLVQIEYSRRHMISIPSFYTEDKILVEEIGHILFCGEIYQFLKLNVSKKFKEGFSQYFYSFDDIEKTISKFPNKVIDEFNSLYTRFFLKSKTSKKEKFKRYFEKITTESKDKIIEKHIQFDSPIILYVKGSKDKLIINPTLKDFEFFKVKDPFTTFQEISMFLSGIIGEKENETVNITDKNRLEMHGYDKYSFRKDPTKKRS